jgi:restriction system protein
MDAGDRRYWMVRLGKGEAWASDLISGGEIGVHFVGDTDMTPYLSPTPRPFHEAVQPIFLALNPGKSKIAVGLAVGNLWVAVCNIFEGDIVLSPVGNNSYAVGEVVGPYRFVPGTPAPHRRAVRWDPVRIERDSMGSEMRRAMVPAMTVFNLDPYGPEIEALRGRDAQGVSADITTLDERTAFQLEKQLEDFLVQNWANTQLGREYDIYQDENGTGQQYPTDTGRLDILAISKDKKRLLVVELKRGRPSDDVVGQVLRYMGWAKRELAESSQEVHGLIIALEDDLRVRNALSMTTNVGFMTYKVKFELTEVSI